MAQAGVEGSVRRRAGGDAGACAQGAEARQSGQQVPAERFAEVRRLRQALQSPGSQERPVRLYICGTLFTEGTGTCSARYLNAPRLEAFVVEKIDERQSRRKIAVLVGGGLKPLRISDKAEAPQGPLPRHESTRNRLPGPCGVCRSLSSRLPAVRSSFVERGAQ